MATLVNVPVRLSNDKSPTKEQIKAIIATFFPQEWPLVDPATLDTTVTPSFSNSHCIVHRPASPSQTEPTKLFVKIHKNADSAVMHSFDALVPTKQEEASLCYEYGRLGFGAKMHGFFETRDGTQGRVDEFLEARNLQPRDVEDEEIRADVARAFATFHTMEMGLVERSVEGVYEVLIAGLAKFHQMEKLKRLGREGGVDIDALVDYDFGARLRRVVERLQTANAKVGWCIHDVQYMNVMITHASPPKPILIDFEFVMRNYRAFDLGGHFMQKLFKWFDKESMIADCRPFTQEEKRHFCNAYVERWKELTGDKDTGEGVLFEAELGYLLAICFDVHNMLCFMEQTDDRDPLSLTGLNRLLKEFADQATKLGMV